MGNNNFYKKLKELKSGGTKISVIQDSIDISIIANYYKVSKKVKKELNDKYNYLSEIHKLYDPEIDTETKQEVLCTLASFDNPEYFNALKKFKDFAPANLKDWTVAAIQESRMLLESTLFDTQTLYISTGLGGKENSLRFFVVLFSEKEQQFSCLQKELIEKEFTFSFSNEGGEVEKIEFDEIFIKITVLLPLEKQVYITVKDIVEECNKYGNFIKKQLLVTNVKRLCNKEIEFFYKKIKSNEEGNNIDL